MKRTRDYTVRSFKYFLRIALRKTLVTSGFRFLSFFFFLSRNFSVIFIGIKDKRNGTNIAEDFQAYWDKLKMLCKKYVHNLSKILNFVRISRNIYFFLIEFRK